MDLDKSVLTFLLAIGFLVVYYVGARINSALKGEEFDSFVFFSNLFASRHRYKSGSYSQPRTEFVIPDWAKGDDEEEKVDKEKADEDAFSDAEIEAAYDAFMASQEEKSVTGGETEAPEETEISEEAAWICPQCGESNPAYQYACKCGNRFR